MDMKKTIMLLAVIGSLFFTSCSDDNDWDYDHSLENVYFFGPQVWGYESNKKSADNVAVYQVDKGDVVAIPMQFWCEFIRSYDVTTFYYTTPKPIDQQYYPTPNDTKKVKYSGPELVRGVDYEVVDENGNVISPDSDGAFSFLWKNAQKGVQNVYIKALPGAKSGSFNLQTFNPASSVKLSNQDVESTVQSRTDKYEVRIFTQNYYVTVTIK